MRIGTLWNKLANPKNVPRIFAFSLGVILLIGFIVPMSLNPDQIYPRPEPQEQIDAGLAVAPYDRGGEILKTPGIVMAQFPQNAEEIGMITSYMSPVALWVSQISPYFGTSIYSSPGGLIDEILYYTRGFDTILESSILMMAFIIASWLALNFTMNHKNDEEVIKEDVKKAINSGDNLSSQVNENNRKAHEQQNWRDN